MQPPPSALDEFAVVVWSPLDSRHTRTGSTKHTVRGRDLGTPAALAICRDAAANAFYLFYCDSDWTVLTDTFHESLSGAKSQAEYEFAGVDATWLAAT